ncbi:hypothetical protein TNCV_5119971 [Trichonephila clavipes]|nr:hypothetical protein TNCV_5119971 [Trichonephila clavipes]
MFNNCRGAWSFHTPDSFVLGVINFLNRKELLISEKESLPALICNPSQMFSTFSKPYVLSALPLVYVYIASQMPQRILIGQWKGPLRGRVCGGRVACVVGDGSKERSAESGPRGRGTWLRMARRQGLAHIEKSSLALALDRARQHVMGVSPLSSFEESSGGYTGHRFASYGDKKIFPLPLSAVPSTGAILPPVLKNSSSTWADRVESSTLSSGADKTTFSSIEEQQTVPDSARYFIMRTTKTFSKVSPFLSRKPYRVV